MTLRAPRIFIAVLVAALAAILTATTASPSAAGTAETRVRAYVVVVGVSVGTPQQEAAGQRLGKESARVVVVVATGVAAKSADTVVLGHYPEYVDLAKATGGRTFQVPTKVWDSWSPTEQWAANQKFLDRAIARGSNVQLATPANAAREGSFFERELQYMQSRGYSVGPDGTSLIAPGGP